MKKSLAALVLSGCVVSALQGARSVDYHEKLYILSSASDDMTVVDVATNKIIGAVTVGALPHGIAAPKSQTVLYVATEGEDHGLTVVDPVKDKAVKRFRVFGKHPNEIDVTSDGRYIYLPARGDCRYEVFDTLKEKIVAKIPVTGFPHNVVVSPDDRFMYLSAYDRGSRSVEEVRKIGECTTLNKKIYVVDTKSHKIAATIATEEAPRPIAVSPDGKRLYANTDNLVVSKNSIDSFLIDVVTGRSRVGCGSVAIKGGRRRSTVSNRLKRIGFWSWRVAPWLALLSLSRGPAKAKPRLRPYQFCHPRPTPRTLALERFVFLERAKRFNNRIYVNWLLSPLFSSRQHGNVTGNEHTYADQNRDNDSQLLGADSHYKPIVDQTGHF